MSADFYLNRRAFVGAGILASLRANKTFAQGFAGLGSDADGFKQVLPDLKLEFPRDLGSHPDYRIEWWYLTANLQDRDGVSYGVQWTLFRQAMRPGEQESGWDNQQIWMGHAAVTRSDLHRYSERFARGGIGQAGVEAAPFRAWINSWDMRGLHEFSDQSISPLEVTASGPDFSYALRLMADRPLVLQGDAGYSKKSELGQASYYFSQPYFKADGEIRLDGKSVQVSGLAWMDREWSSQPLASDQTGWDWFSLHLNSGEKLMLFRLRQTNGKHYFSGNWIGIDGRSDTLAANPIVMTPVAFSTVAGRKVPTAWSISVPERGLKIDSSPLNTQSWMATRFAYWEGPIHFQGSHSGMGYLEMTGY